MQSVPDHRVHRDTKHFLEEGKAKQVVIFGKLRKVAAAGAIIKGAS
jgi:hypothetical protein